MGDLAEDGEHGALGRFANRCIGGIGGLGEGRCDQHRIDQLARTGSELFGGTPDDLAENHAGVAPGAHQRRAGEGGNQLGAPDLVQ